MDKPQPQTQQPPAPKKARSPAYPSLSLADAIAKVATLWREDKGAPQSMSVMAAHWKSTEKSSAFLQWVATLKQFGLLEELNTQGSRQFKLTRLAKDIVMFEKEPENPVRLKAIKQVALIPKIHAELWKDYGTDLPSDTNLIHFLATSKTFQETAAKDLVRCYKKTISFANLGKDDKVKAVNQTVVVGDLVQWESNGVAQFTEPRLVSGISPDGQFVFVEGQPCGLPVGEVTRVEPTNGIAMNPVVEQAPAPATGVGTPPPNPHYKPAALPPGVREFTLTTDTGNVVLRWPETLSDEDYETIDGWLDGMKKKIKRSVKDAGETQN